MSNLLSICIPTYNRIHYLKEFLPILLPQAEKVGVEVCISDNCSIDETKDYLLYMSYKFTCLKYIVQEKNFGLEKNMLFAISMAKNKYILLIGDDDFIPNEKLSTILDSLEDDLDLLILDGWHTDSFLNPRKPHLPEELKGICFTSPFLAFVKLWDKMHLGSFLAHRDYFLPVFFERYIGTSHAYTGMVWDYLAQKYRKSSKVSIKCMSTSTVLIRGGEKSWHKNTALIMLYEIPRWFYLLKKDYESQVNPILANYLKRQATIINLLRYQAIDQLNLIIVNNLMTHFSPYQQLKAKIIGKIPVMFSKKIINLENNLIKIIRPLKYFIYR